MKKSPISLWSEHHLTCVQTTELYQSRTLGGADSFRGVIRGTCLVSSVLLGTCAQIRLFFLLRCCLLAVLRRDKVSHSLPYNDNPSRAAPMRDSKEHTCNSGLFKVSSDTGALFSSVGVTGANTWPLLHEMHLKQTSVSHSVARWHFLLWLVSIRKHVTMRGGP